MPAPSSRFRDLVASSRDERDRVKQLVASRQWRKAEPDQARFQAFMSRRVNLKALSGAEALQGDTVDLQAVAFLTQGAVVRRAVAYVEVNAAGRSEAGTGFLISPDLFLTNQHVIANVGAAHGTQIIFDREMDEIGRPRPTTTFLLDPDRFALLSQEEELDYALFAVGTRLTGSASLSDFGCCPLIDRPDKHVLGMNVNIIQHPGGWPKMIAVRNNLLDYRTDRTLLYETDTDHGSSGSPVFNDLWELIALHHYGEPFLERTDDQGRPIPTTVNEGVRISAIYHDLAAKLPMLSAEGRTLLQRALDQGRSGSASSAGKKLSPPRLSTIHRESTTLQPKGAVMAAHTSGSELRIVVPLEISIRVGGAISASAPETAELAVKTSSPAKILKRGAEKLKVDQDYGNRHGYDADFISGFHLGLPEPDAELAKQVAPLRPSEPRADEGELLYEHFSVKLNKAKRMAMFTATNIDGETYLNIDRRTGLVSNEGSEAETWFQDPRVSASFYLDNTFYSEWSTYFDHGHLTRRTDPTWGTDDEAERANADTYHFTNCSPQHFRFNQSAKFWQGIERYVLEKGALSGDTPARLTVFQGPIFSDAIDHMADDVQIPSSFFKVVVWMSKTGLRSVGLVVDQLALLDEERSNLGKPRDVPIDVKQWRVPIQTIEKRTGLSFGDRVRDADTISQPEQPKVGEAQILIRAMSDLLP